MNNTLTIWRDSVSMGDDADAPHELLLEVTPNTTLQEVTEFLIKEKYLATIAGGRATWILQSNKPLAVVAQQWEQAQYLTAPETLIAECIETEKKPNLQFSYKLATNPDRLVATLLNKQTGA